MRAQSMLATASELCLRTRACLCAVLQTLQTVGKGDKLKGFELVRAVHLDSVQVGALLGKGREG